MAVDTDEHDLSLSRRKLLALPPRLRRGGVRILLRRCSRRCARTPEEDERGVARRPWTRVDCSHNVPYGNSSITLPPSLMPSSRAIRPPNSSHKVLRAASPRPNLVAPSGREPSLVAWAELYGEFTPPLDLPRYPFRGERLWIDPAEPNVAGSHGGSENPPRKRTDHREAPAAAPHAVGGAG